MLRRLGLVGAVFLSACGGDVLEINTRGPDPERDGDLATSEEAALRVSSLFDAEFRLAAEEFGVPPALLKAIAYSETRYEMIQGETEFDGRPVAYGLMALSGEKLERGAFLAGVTVEEARSNALANIRAAAALLSHQAELAGIDRTKISDWQKPLEAYSALPELEAREHFVLKDVFGTLKLGVGAFSDELVQRGQSLELDGLGVARQELSAGPDYGIAVYRPSPNQDARAFAPHMIIIHTCEGSYVSCWSWLTNPAAGASAHYVVNSTGSEISQLVPESRRAWHIAASYNCNLNGGHECSRNGVNSNHFTIGIEHAGFAKQSSWPTGQIDASARLSCDISRDRGIPRDRYHIVGHGQLQPYNRTDPGPNWPWSTYLAKVNGFCGSTGGGSPAGGGSAGALIIDSNNANNDKARGYVQVSGSWTGTNSTPGYYGSGYFFASTKPVSDGATFWFYLPAPATKTIDAWWTAGANRSNAAPFVAFNAAGEKLGTAYVDQQTGGKQWTTVGTWSFSAGWNKVVLSRWAQEGHVVIADAIRVR